MRYLTLVIVFLALPTQRSGAAGADLVCCEPVVDKGEVRSGSLLVQHFTLRNQGAGTVEVNEVKPGCGCLTPRLEKRQFQPGERGTLELSVNTLTAATGPQTWRVQVFYRSAGRTEALELVLRANVIPEITIEPAALVVFTSGPIRRDLTLIECRPRPLALTDVRCTSPYLQVQAGAPVRNQAGHWSRVLTLEVLPACPPGRHQEAITIAPADPMLAEWQVPVTVVKHSRNAVRVTPEAITFTGPARQALPARLIRISARDEQEVVVDRVEAGDPAIQCEWAQGPGRQITLKVRVDAAKAPAGLQSEVRLYLRQPAAQSVTIPVLWTPKTNDE
jgi:hypothetical protein